MKKTILAMAIASAMVAGVAGATGYSNYNPNSASFEGIVGVAVTSSASSSTNGLGNTGGYQSSGAYATNTVAAGASSVPSVVNGVNTVNLSAHTASNGYTVTYAKGTGLGTSDALAIQGGAATAQAEGTARDYSIASQKNNTRYNYREGTYKTAGMLGAANASGEIDSASSAGSLSYSQNDGNGEAYQESSAGARNVTTAVLEADVTLQRFYPETSAATHTKAEIITNGETWAYGNDNGTGFAGGIASQEGGGTANTYSYEMLSQSTGTYDGWKNGYRDKTPLTRVNQSGMTQTEIDASTSGFSAALGSGNNSGFNSNVSGASARSIADQKGLVQGDGLTQTTAVQVDTFAYHDQIQVGQAIGEAEADANGSGFGFGTINGGTVTYYPPCYDCGDYEPESTPPWGNNGIGNGLFDGTNPGTWKANTPDND